MTLYRKNVLYLTYDGLTDPLGQSQILPYLCGLSRDYSITIISFEKPDRLAIDHDRIKRICDDNRLHWVPMRYHKRPPIVSAVYDVWMLRRKARSLHRKHGFGIVHCRSYITALVGLMMKRRFGVKFIFDMRGFWADERVDGGLWRINNPLYKAIYSFFKRKEAEFVAHADNVVSLTENARTEILTWNLTTRISVIPCCVDLHHFNPSQVPQARKDALRATLGLAREDFVLLYLGSFGTWYMTSEMFDFFAALKTVNPTARFLIITPDPVELDEFPYKEDVIIRKASRSEVPEYISLANFSVLFIKPAFSKKASSATKMAEILAMGVPVITNEGWGDIELFKLDLHGMATVRDQTDYNDVLRNLAVEVNPTAIREAAAQRFSLAKGIECYRDIYDALT